jgi:predicted RNase H-like nuclease (RuvC/YqgF family)
MMTEQHAVDSQRNDPLLTTQCCDTLNSSDENERTLEDLCECLRTIFEELRSKVEILPDPTSETYLNDTESRNKLYHTVNNVEKLIQDLKKRMMNASIFL